MPVPVELLMQHCAAESLAAAETYPELESTAARLWVCVQRHNADKARIQELK